MGDLIYAPFPDHRHVPEPDWEELRDILVQAESWLRSDAPDALPSIFACEAVGLCIAILDATFEDMPTDDIIRCWVENVNSGANWFACMADDPALSERLLRLYDDSRAEPSSEGSA